MIDEIEKIIDEEIRPYISSHGGNIQFINFSDGIVEVKIYGRCCNCPSLNITLHEVIREKLLRVNGVRNVMLSEIISNKTLEFAKKLLRIE